MVRSTSTASPVLSGILQKYWQQDQGFVAPIIAPVFRTALQAATYYVFDKDNMLDVPENMNRAPSTEYQTIGMKCSDDTYSCRDRGVKVPVDDGERAKVANAFSADDAAMRIANNVVKIAWERRVHTLAAGSSVAGAAPSPKWDQASSYPINDVKAGIETIRLATGVKPNFIIIPQTVFDVLMEHTQLTAKIVQSTGGFVTTQFLAQAFGIPRVIIPGINYNSATQGQTVVPADIWGFDVVMGVSNDIQDLKAPNFMRTFNWTQMTGGADIAANRVREELKHTDHHEAFHWTDEKLTGALLGFRLPACIT